MSLAEQWNTQIRDGLEDDFAGPEWLRQLREKGADTFARSGLPHRKVEDWKYTSLKLLEARSHQLETDERNDVSPGVIGWPDPVLQKPDGTLKIANGRLQSGFDSPPGIRVVKLREALADADTEAWLREILESLPAEGAAQAFSSLNNSTLRNGVVIRVPAGVDGGTLLAQWSFDNIAPAMLFSSRVVIVLEEGASLSLVEQFESTDPLPHALNLVTQVRIAKRASLSHVRVQDESDQTSLITRTECDVLAGGKYETSSFDWGAAWVRHDTHVRLRGDDAHGTVNGAFLLSGEQHLDHHVFVDHVAGGSSSKQFFRGVLGGSSRGVFNGKARITKGADGSSIRQSNANLLLSPLAEIDTKPELEIYADEVEASHGATVGQLDEDAIFYLRTRGLDEHSARTMLTSAFCKAVLDRTPGISAALAEEIAIRMDAALTKRVAAEAAPTHQDER